MSSESELRYGKVAHRRRQREASSGPAPPTGAPPAPPGHLMPCVRGTRVTTLSPHGRCGAASSTFYVTRSGEGMKAILNLSPDQELGEKNHNSISSPKRVSFAASDFTSPVDTLRSQWLRPLGGMRTARGPRSGLALGRGGAVPRWAPPGSGCGEGGGKICASRPEPRVPPSWAESLPRGWCLPGPREAGEEEEDLRAANIPFQAAMSIVSIVHSAHIQIPFGKVNPALM